MHPLDDGAVDTDKRRQKVREAVWGAFTKSGDDRCVDREAPPNTVLDGPLYNTNGGQHEIWLEGPEGYRVVVAGPRNVG
ncbi:MAG: hypothetical protein E4H00_10060 [Myxococcales bacterium]|nr:MAG: hypothetical protein E4H00_10060 [Myxococcales bacterium]